LLTSLVVYYIGCVLTEAARQGLLARMMQRVVQIGVVALALTAAYPANAMVGGAPAAEGGAGRAVVTIVGSRGNFCSGALIAPDLVLSAAHCVPPDATYKIVAYDERRQPKLLDVRRVAIHPQFNVKGIRAHRASADVALLQLNAPMAANTPAPLGAPNEPITAGARFSVAGIGVTRHGDGKSGGTIRAATLTATGRPGTLQIRLVDPATNNAREGLGACTGDSGAPVFEEQNGRSVIVGVVSWSTGANNTAGCGGLTGVTPLTLYRDWILKTVRGWGGAM
jgi:secreted trypsin-like serine protease